MGLITTKLSNQKIAERINKEFNLSLTRRNIYYFRRKILPKAKEEAYERDPLIAIRSEVWLDYIGAIIKSMFQLEKQLNEVINNTTLDTCKRANMVAKLINEKGKLLILHKRLSGELR